MKKICLFAVFILTAFLIVGTVSAANTGSTIISKDGQSENIHGNVCAHITSYTRTDSGSRTFYSTKFHRYVKLTWTASYNPYKVHYIGNYHISSFVVPVSMYITKPTPNTIKMYGTSAWKAQPSKTIYTKFTASEYYWFMRPLLIRGYGF